MTTVIFHYVVFLKKRPSIETPAMIKKWIAYNTAKRRERELEKARKNISLQTDKLARDIVARHSRGSVAIQIGSVITKDEMENLLKKYF